jgi:nucleotide-binding universal stress UspA family protein
MMTPRTERDAPTAGDLGLLPNGDGHGPPVTSCALLATDGSVESTGAVALAAALVRLRGATVRAVTVIDTASYPGSGFEPATAAASAAAESMADGVAEGRTRETVIRQLSDLLGDEAAATATFVRGRTVPMIVREAEDARASMIVLGLDRHDLLDRLWGEETALRVARTAPMPVLAVTPALRQLPRRIVVAVDFSPASVRAARQVFSLAAEGARIVLAHVRPPVSERDHDDDNAHYELGVGSALTRLIGTLPSAPRVTTETVSLEGDPVEQLRRLAASSDCDLIALGSHRHSFVGRLMLGSVTTELIRAAEVSVFVAPPVESPPAS